MNRIKLRELDRRKPMEKHVRAGTPFCGLQLLEPIAVQLRSGLPVTTRMRKHGVFSIDNLEQVPVHSIFPERRLQSIRPSNELVRPFGHGPPFSIFLEE